MHKYTVIGCSHGELGRALLSDPVDVAAANDSALASDERGQLRRGHSVRLY